MIMTTKNHWMTDWEQSQDDKNDELYSSKRTAPLIQVSPLAKYSLVELLTEVMKRVAETPCTK